jgi:hypothetical protein
MPHRTLRARASEFHPPGIHGQAPRLARADTWAENIQGQFFDFVKRALIAAIELSAAKQNHA